MYVHLLFEKFDGIIKISLNRPELLNAINIKLLSELHDVIEKVKSDPEVKVVVLTGVGKAFSSGIELKVALGEIVKAPQLELLDRVKKFHEMMYSLYTIDKITIAAINGLAIGLGLSLTLACDLRIASEKAILATGYIRLGLHPDGGLTYFVTKLTNPAKALELFLASDFIDAKEAERIGLVNRVVPHEKLDEEVMSLARKIAQGPSTTIRLLKSTIHECINADLKTILEREALAIVLSSKTEDAEEGVRALIEKRQPQFKGR
ncbi:MAG: enoyl-CoA hydratase-related protein [Candidatus Nezhaarchaeales archaeon]